MSASLSMSTKSHQKITASHLGRAAYVYVRRNPILRISDSIDAAAAVMLVLNY